MDIKLCTVVSMSAKSVNTNGEKKEPRHFSDKVSAELFYDEYAMCQMTGKTLWLLDKGIVYWDGVQIDHILPWSIQKTKPIFLTRDFRMPGIFL